MTERDPSTRTRPHACIDPSPLYLWPLEEALEMFPADIADSPQARRLAVLIAEAQAAGRNVAVLAWLCDAARVLLACTAQGPGRTTLANAITAAEAVAFREQRLNPELRTLLDELSELQDPDNPAEVAASALAGWAVGSADRLPFSAKGAWDAATVLLAAIAQTAGDPDPAIARCAELAYTRLFALTIAPHP